MNNKPIFQDGKILMAEELNNIVQYIDITTNNLDDQLTSVKDQIEHTEAVKITRPQQASVGQILIVKQIDQDGRPIEWETVDPSYSNGVIALTEKEYEEALGNNKILATTYYYIYEDV